MLLMSFYIRYSLFNVRYSLAQGEGNHHVEGCIVVAGNFQRATMVMPYLSAKAKVSVSSRRMVLPASMAKTRPPA